MERVGELALLGLTWILFAVGAWLVRRLPARTSAALILLGGVALPLVGGLAPPGGSDDLYRYQWDGRVQAAGFDPYRYAPAASELVRLRDPVLWPAHSNWCVPAGATDHEAGRPLAPGCTLINRPTVHTIYPPVAQAYFLAVDVLSPAGTGSRPIQLAAAIAAMATTLLLLAALPRLGLDRRWAVLWAWCPTIALEAANNAHVDVIAALLTAAALSAVALARTRQASALGGALLGLAIATKLTPALLLPAVLRRHPLTVLAAAIGATGTVYLPHVIAVGAHVIGYIPGYLSEEGYTNGSRFALLTLVLPRGLATPAAVAILIGIAVAVARQADPDRPWHGATIMTGAAMLITTPSYPWYAILLVLLVAFDGRAEWFAVAAAGYLAQHAPDLHLAVTTGQRLGYGSALLAILTIGFLRQRTASHKEETPA